MEAPDLRDDRVARRSNRQLRGHAAYVAMEFLRNFPSSRGAGLSSTNADAGALLSEFIAATTAAHSHR